MKKHSNNNRGQKRKGRNIPKDAPIPALTSIVDERQEYYNKIADKQGYAKFKGWRRLSSGFKNVISSLFYIERPKSRNTHVSTLFLLSLLLMVSVGGLGFTAFSIHQSSVANQLAAENLAIAAKIKLYSIAHSNTVSDFIKTSAINELIKNESVRGMKFNRYSNEVSGPIYMNNSNPQYGLFAAEASSSSLLFELNRATIADFYSINSELTLNGSGYIFSGLFYNSSLRIKTACDKAYKDGIKQECIKGPKIINMYGMGISLSVSDVTSGNMQFVEVNEKICSGVERHHSDQAYIERICSKLNSKLKQKNRFLFKKSSNINLSTPHIDSFIISHSNSLSIHINGSKNKQNSKSSNQIIELSSSRDIEFSGDQRNTEFALHGSSINFNNPAKNNTRNIENTKAFLLNSPNSVSFTGNFHLKNVHFVGNVYSPIKFSNSTQFEGVYLVAFQNLICKDYETHPFRDHLVFDTETGCDFGIKMTKKEYFSKFPGLLVKSEKVGNNYLNDVKNHLRAIFKNL